MVDLLHIPQPNKNALLFPSISRSIHSVVRGRWAWQGHKQRLHPAWTQGIARMFSQKSFRRGAADARARVSRDGSASQLYRSRLNPTAPLLLLRMGRDLPAIYNAAFHFRSSCRNAHDSRMGFRARVTKAPRRTLPSAWNIAVSQGPARRRAKYCLPTLQSSISFTAPFIWF